jgi:hypothetical protein
MDRRNVRKIFVQRDYSRGTGVRFSTDFPRELTGKVDETTYRTTIENVNQCFDEAEALGCCNVLEGCLACMTGFALHYCFKTHYERVSLYHYCLCETGVNRSHCMYVLARLL